MRSVAILSIFVSVVRFEGVGSCDSLGDYGEMAPNINSDLRVHTIITGNNDRKLIATACMGILGNSQQILLGTIQLEPSDYVDHPIMFTVSRMLKDIISKVNFSFGSASTPYVKTVHKTEMSTGECGGNETINMDINEQTGEISSGNILDDNYCMKGITSSGPVNYTGYFNKDTGKISLTLNFINISIKSKNSSETLNGSFQWIQR
jgi:hypothetical protein